MRWAPALLLTLIVRQGVAITLIKQKNDPLIKKSGDDINLECKDWSVVQWVTPTIAKKSIVRNSVNIKSAEPKHTGQYTCINPNSSENRSLYLFVEDSRNLFVPPSIRQMFISGYEGSEAVIPCRVTSPIIDDFRLERSKGASMPQNLSYTVDIYTGISITNLKRSFDGYYVCTARKNGILRKSKDYKLQIVPVPKSPPEINLEVNKELLKEGETFQLSCIVKNVNHEVTVNWNHPQTTATTKTKLSNNFPNHYKATERLTIDSVKVNDTGHFTCFAKNRFGMSNATVFLQVVGKTLCTTEDDTI